MLHWKLEKGALPPGIKFEDDGLLHGKAERAGEFQFTVSVTDGGKPQQAVQKGFVLRVRSALSLNWKAPAVSEWEPNCGERRGFQHNSGRHGSDV